MPSRTSSRLWRTILAGGPAESLHRVLRRLLGRTSRVIRVHPFDEQYGVETSGLIVGKYLSTGHAHDAFSTAYFGVPPSRFKSAIKLWQETPNTLPITQYTFIDIGSGKGRALLLASTLGFQKVTGVELHTRLAQVAEQNIRVWQQAGLKGSPIELLCADATAAVKDLVSGPTLLYLFNPFLAPVLRSLLELLVKQRDRLTSPLDLLYLYPEYASAFAEFPEFQLLWNRQIPLAADECMDGISTLEDPCHLYRLTPLP